MIRRRYLPALLAAALAFAVIMIGRAGPSGLFLYRTGTFGSVVALGGAAALAADDDVNLQRVFACTGTDVKMEIYMAGGALTGTSFKEIKLAAPVAGAYIFDHSAVGKGKSLEPVSLSLSPDRSALLMTRFSRDGSLVVRIPENGGPVDFDRRWGAGSTCGPFAADLRH